MPQSRGGTIQRAALQRTLRVAAAVVAVALAVGAVWLIVTAKNAKHAQVGALLGFWSLLMAAFSGLGGRTSRPADPHTASDAPLPGTAVDLRPIGWLDRIEDAERRVGYERELLELVRHEIASSLAPEIANLRSDVAALRGEILDTVGGQIRLERIETTRMIGSDLEALQRELRQLRTGPTDVPEPVDRREAITAAVVPPPVPAPRVPPPAPPPPADASAPPPAETLTAPPVENPTAPPFETPVGVTPEDTPTAAVPVDPEPYEDEDDNDPFALLPRTTPYVEPEPEPEVVAEPVGAYSGRRRAADDQASTTGRHSVEDRDWSSSAPRRIGGRRRRDDDAGHDVLARILERESPRA